MPTCYICLIFHALLPKWGSTRVKNLSLFQVKTLRRFQRVDSPSSGPVPAFWGAYRRLRQYRQRCFAPPFAVGKFKMNRMMMMQGGHTGVWNSRPTDRTEQQTGNLEHIQRWTFSWELIAHARTSSLSRQIWGTPILLIVRPTYATITISTTITTSVVY